MKGLINRCLHVYSSWHDRVGWLIKGISGSVDLIHGCDQDGKWLKLHQSELVKLGVQEAKNRGRFLLLAMEKLRVTMVGLCWVGNNDLLDYVVGVRRQDSGFQEVLNRRNSGFTSEVVTSCDHKSFLVGSQTSSFGHDTTIHRTLIGIFPR